MWYICSHASLLHISRLASSSGKSQTLHLPASHSPMLSTVPSALLPAQWQEWPSSKAPPLPLFSASGGQALHLTLRASFSNVNVLQFCLLPGQQQTHNTGGLYLIRALAVIEQAGCRVDEFR